MFTDSLEMEKARATLTGRKPFIRPPMDNRANAPQRKNGLFLSGAAQGSDGVCSNLIKRYVFSPRLLPNWKPYGKNLPLLHSLTRKTHQEGCRL
jgi:hypothetical protein